ncbi:MAG: hypothetical protein Fues2KO_34470 [Fuerstiella sp.]
MKTRIKENEFRRSAESLKVSIRRVVMTIATLGVLSTGPSVAAAADPNDVSEETAAESEPAADIISNYCGIYSLYAVASTLGEDCAFRDFIRPEYVTSREGSSGRDLVRAANDKNLNAVFLKDIVYEDLLNMNTPAILHTSTGNRMGKYNHWVTFLGGDRNHARIAEADDGMYEIPVAELLAMWDGTAVAVSKENISGSTITARRAGTFIFIILTIQLLRTVGRKRLPTVFTRGRIGAQACAIVVAALCLGFGHHATANHGLLKHRTAVEMVKQAFVPTFLDKIHKADVLRLIRDVPNLVIIDARFHDDYLSGHLPDAISVPVNSTQTQLRKLLGKVSMDSPVVVYCQSAGCKFDDRIASMLVAEGFSDVRLFHEGWVGWQSTD